MANIDFPASPSVNDVYTINGTSWTWTGTVWNLVSASSGESMGRNLVHNGAMQVAQRGASVAGITAGGYFTADRWAVNLATLGTWTQSVENDAPTGSGFRKSFKMLVTTADAAPAAGDFAFFQHRLEGQDLQRICKGTANAKPLTLSFWTKANVTGTHTVWLYDADNGRSVSAAYTVSASATWEQKTITFPADTTGVFDNDNVDSLWVMFMLAAGSNHTSGTLGTTWAADVVANRAVGQVNVAAATNNFWSVTGIQLETGSVATPFEFRSYGDELRTCQRYYETSYAVGVAAGTNTGIGCLVHGGGTDSGGNLMTTIRFVTPKRSTTYTPVAYALAGTANVWNYERTGSVSTVTASMDRQTETSFRIFIGITTTYTAALMYGHWVVSADL